MLVGGAVDEKVDGEMVIVVVDGELNEEIGKDD